MTEKYILSIDQSTAGTKALLFNQQGRLCTRCDIPHKQHINEKGWVEHDPEEIYANVVQVVKDVMAKAAVEQSAIIGMGMSSQRETVVLWNRITGRPVYNAIVWQCARAEDICIRNQQYANIIQNATGLPLSPYFSAAKAAWILENVEGVKNLAEKNQLCCGTIDSWLLWKLTKGEVFKTDYSNASRTQLFNIRTLQWDKEVCSVFGIPMNALAEVCGSDSLFGYTDLEGYFSKPIPIHGVLGDSHGALYGQGCHQAGTIKATFGTGSSVMLNTGSKPIFSEQGIVTSLAWGTNNTITYVLEGNINYTGAVIKWMAEDLQLLQSSKESGGLAQKANPNDTTYLVPAFSGLGAPYWDSKAKAMICGMTRNTGRAELVKAAEESIAYQITDIVKLMEQESRLSIQSLSADGGPTGDRYLMQFLSNILNKSILVSETEELSGTGAAFLTGIAMEVYPLDVAERINKQVYKPNMCDETRKTLYSGWKKAVELVLSK